VLGYGKSGGLGDRYCVVELAAALHGVEVTDDPQDLSLVAARFLRTWNDALKDDARQRLAPYAGRLCQTTRNASTERARAASVADWLVHECAAAWLVCAGEPEIVRLLPASSRHLAGDPPELAEESLVAGIRRVTALSGVGHGRSAKREGEIRARLLSSGTAAAWVSYRDWSWSTGCRFQISGSPELRIVWYSWLLCWRAVQLAIVRQRDSISTTECNLQHSAFRLLDQLTK
jgi:hypothetical protein